MFTAAKEKAEKLAGAQSAPADGLQSGVLDICLDKAKDTFDVAGALQKKLLKRFRRFVKKKVHKTISKKLDDMPGIIKKKSDDPLMPDCVRQRQNYVIDAVCQDIKEEIMWELTAAMDKAKDENVELDNPPCCLIAFWRYHLFPVDKTFWGTIRDPWWIFFKIISAIPLCGVAPACHFFIFLIIDKSDEYQLIFFILRFKGMQFLTLGILRAFIGYAQYYGCTIDDGERHTCKKRGPGTGPDFWLTNLGFVVCLLLGWIAFLLLPYSKDKGRAQLKGVIDTEKFAKAKQGGYLQPFLFYDFCIFVMCGIGILVLYLQGHTEWQLRADIYWIQTLYGVTAFPFAIFTLPVLQSLLTHSRKTAYDSEGRCVPPSRPEPEPEKEENDDAEYNALFADAGSEYDDDEEKAKKRRAETE
eukprot:gnl/MRDRNA2_/MRDRNA2_73791_c0_seq1.p1 gnl/MRDRNA2_/MRDRNA2_73791_c0~~gnl/MRDRNA2_/MRDRNA2_73791_c0_seq1.p1  ORF type:complete len:414 (+),score=69.61 gnl/MRDRNA2_/MRDRNA2_73791_c0_seq1:63-1304(+)